MEEIPHQGEGSVIENGAYRPYENHEPLDIANIPFQWFFNEVRIDVVRSLLGYVHCGIHRNSDIGRFQRWRIIDTVPHEPDHQHGKGT